MGKLEAEQAIFKEEFNSLLERANEITVAANTLKDTVVGNRASFLMRREALDKSTQENLNARIEILLSTVRNFKSLFVRIKS